MVRPGSRKTVAAATDCSRTHRSGYQHRFSTRRRRVPSGAHRTLRTALLTGQRATRRRPLDGAAPGPGLGTVRRTGRGLAEHLGQLGKAQTAPPRPRRGATAARRRAGRRPVWPAATAPAPAPGAPRPSRPARCRPSSAAAPPPPRRAARPPRRGPRGGPDAHRRSSICSRASTAGSPIFTRRALASWLSIAGLTPSVCASRPWVIPSPAVSRRTRSPSGAPYSSRWRPRLRARRVRRPAACRSAGCRPGASGTGGMLRMLAPAASGPRPNGEIGHPTCGRAQAPSTARVRATSFLIAATRESMSS